MKPVELFHIGPQKAATTWVYYCLKEHPQVACPPSDSIHYFDMFYSRGREWYGSFFQHAQPEQKLFDPTYTYIRSPWAPRRIFAENPQAKIVLCMRHPIERAFSHYWHEKKKVKYNFDFSEVLNNYDLFASWIEPGLYAEHIERYLGYFPKDQILCQLFDDLEDDPSSFLKQLLVFLEVDAEFIPSMLEKKVNVAGTRSSLMNRGLRKIGEVFARAGFLHVPSGTNLLSRLLSGKYEYLRGVPHDLYDPLWEICKPEIERLEELLEIDLRLWQTRP